MKSVIIKKGKHLSNQSTGIRLRKSTGMISAIVMFTNSCKYNVGSDQADWNKLFGCSWGFLPLGKQFMMHHESSRWAWRYNAVTRMIEVCPYYYINGRRNYPEVSGFDYYSVPIGVEIFFSISPSQDKVLYVAKSDLDHVGYFHAADHKVEKLNGFTAPPYFGGNVSAPETIEILIEKK